MAHSDSDLEIDLLADWHDFLRRQLTLRGYPPPAGDRDVDIAFFNLLNRLVPVAPRTIHVARGLSCPAGHEAGYQEVTRKVRDGEDVRAHLSRGLAKLDYNDGLLNDWGIHHLHLGTSLDSDGFVKRTGPVLFARFEAREAFFIGIPQHGAWSDTRVLEELDKNWPAITDRYVLKGVVGLEYTPTSSDVKEMRRAGGQLILWINDKALAPLGGGITTAGVGVGVVMKANAVNRQLKTWEEWVVSQREAIFARAKEDGHSFVRPLRLRLRFTREEVAFAESEDRAFGVELGRLP
jgi:hypothetical protein